MTSEKRPDLDPATKQAEKRRGYPGTFYDVIIALLESDVESQSVQRQYAKDFNSKLLGVVKGLRPMQPWIVFAAAFIPPVLLVLLLGHIYCYMPMLFGAAFDAEKAKAIAGLSTPLTALIIGTFASFIIVYSTLLVGIFSQLKTGMERYREKNSALNMPVVANAVEKVINHSG